LLAHAVFTYHDGSGAFRVSLTFGKVALMRSSTIRVLGVLSGISLAAVAWGEAFTIELKVQTNGSSQTAHAEPISLGAVPKARKVLKGKAGVPLKISWTVASAGAKTDMKNILVHFFTVKEEKLDQQNTPKLTKDVTAESAVSLDFAPGDKSKGSLTFTVDQPGFYLMRLETIGAPEGQDCFAALDLAIQEK
jgi:hypothetical protein